MNASSIQAVALFFVTLFGCAWCLKDMLRTSPTFLVGRWMGVLPTTLCMAALATLGAIWFLRGRQETTGTRVLAVIISSLLLSIFLGTVQGVPETSSLWGGQAGRNMGRLLLQFPAVVATGLAGLGLVMGIVFSFRLWVRDELQQVPRSLVGSGILGGTMEAPTPADVSQPVVLAQPTFQETVTVDEPVADEAEEPDDALEEEEQAPDAESRFLQSACGVELEEELAGETEEEVPAAVVDLEPGEFEAPEEGGALVHGKPEEAQDDDLTGSLFEQPTAEVEEEEPEEAWEEGDEEEEDEEADEGEETDEEEEDEWEDEEGEGDWDEEELEEDDEEAWDDDEEDEEELELEEDAGDEELEDEQAEWEEDVVGPEEELAEDEQGSDEEPDDAEVQVTAGFEVTPREESGPERSARRASSRNRADWAVWDEQPRRPRPVPERDDQQMLFVPSASPDGDLYEKALSLVTEKDRCSVTMLQRHLDISFSAATGLIERMHDEGVVGPQLPSGRREVLVGEELVGSPHDPQS